MLTMTVQFDLHETINGYLVTQIVGGGFYTVRKDNIVICFYTTAGSGKNYCRIEWVTDNNTGRQYRSPRFFIKYVSEIQALSSALFFRYQELVEV